MTLPIADDRTTLAEARLLIRDHRARVARLGVVHLLAVGAGLLAPWLLGAMIDTVVDHRGAARVDGRRLGTST